MNKQIIYFPKDGTPTLIANEWQVWDGERDEEAGGCDVGRVVERSRGLDLGRTDGIDHPQDRDQAGVLEQRDEVVHQRRAKAPA